MATKKQIFAYCTLGALGVAALCHLHSMSNSIGQTNELARAALELARKNAEESAKAGSSSEKLADEVAAKLTCLQKLETPTKMAGQAMELAEKALSAGDKTGARLCYLNAINQNPSDIRAYEGLAKAYEEASAMEREELRNVLLTAQYRVSPDQLPTVRELLAEAQTRWQQELEQETATEEPDPATPQTDEKPNVQAVDLCALLATPQPDYAKAIQMQRAYVDAAEDDAGAEEQLLVLQNLMLLEKVEALISLLEKGCQEFAQAQEDTVATIIDTAIAAAAQTPELSPPDNESDRKLVEQQLSACAGYLDQLLHNNATALTMDSPLAKHLIDRAKRVEGMSLVWQALGDAALIRSEGGLIFQEIDRCVSAIPASAPSPAAQGQKGPITQAILRMNEISKRVMALHARLGGEAAKAKCLQKANEKLAPAVVEMTQKRTEAYNKWVIDLVWASYKQFKKDDTATTWESTSAAKQLGNNELASVDTTYLYPHVAQLYQEYIAMLMGKVDGDYRASSKVRMAKTKKRSLEQY